MLISGDTWPPWSPVIKEFFATYFHDVFVVSDFLVTWNFECAFSINRMETCLNRMWMSLKGIFIWQEFSSYQEKNNVMKINKSENEVVKCKVKKLRQNERLKPSTIETALPKYFRVRNYDHYLRKTFWNFPLLIFWGMVKLLLLPESSWRRKGRKGRGRSSTTLGLLLSLLSSGMRKTFRLGLIIIYHHSFCSRSWSQ